MNTNTEWSVVVLCLLIFTGLVLKLINLWLLDPVLGVVASVLQALPVGLLLLLLLAYLLATAWISWRGLEETGPVEEGEEDHAR